MPGVPHPEHFLLLSTALLKVPHLEREVRSVAIGAQAATEAVHNCSGDGCTLAAAMTFSAEAAQSQGLRGEEGGDECALAMAMVCKQKDQQNWVLSFPEGDDDVSLQRARVKA